MSVGSSMLSETCIQCNCSLGVIAGTERVNGNGIQPAGNLNGPMDTQYRSHYKNAQCNDFFFRPSLISILGSVDVKQYGLFLFHSSGTV